jgi:hypothetical protein
MTSAPALQPAAGAVKSLSLSVEACGSLRLSCYRTVTVFEGMPHDVVMFLFGRSFCAVFKLLVNKAIVRGCCRLSDVVHSGCLN